MRSSNASLTAASGLLTTPNELPVRPAFTAIAMLSLQGKSVLYLYGKDVEFGFLPDYGLSERHEQISKAKWNNAARNLSRDYRNVLKKIG